MKRSTKIDLIKLAFLVAFLIAGIAALPGCRTKPPLGEPGGSYPYPGALTDNSGNVIAPPAWTNAPATKGVSYEDLRP